MTLDQDIKYSLVVSGIRGAEVKEVTNSGGNIAIEYCAVGLPASKDVDVYAILNTAALSRDMTLSPDNLIEADVPVNPLGEIARTWLVPVTCVFPQGDYNLLIDVDKNGQYDPKIDMIDFSGDEDGLSFEKIGFTITTP